MRRSLLLRLLGLSLAVASLSIAATALLATYSTGNHLREELEDDASLLETDSSIRAALLAYASTHRDWTKVEPLLRQLAGETGRRIALTTPEGELIADSVTLLGQGQGGLPPAPSARIDAATPPPREESGRSESALRAESQGLTLAYDDWLLTEDEHRERRELAEEAVACLAREAPPAPPHAAGGDRRMMNYGSEGSIGGDAALPGIPAQEEAELGGSGCIPPELYAPSRTALAINERAVDLTTDCLTGSGLPFDVTTGPDGISVVLPATEAAATDPAWQRCEEGAREQAARAFVAPPADLYLGTSDQFNPFSPGSWGRTAATAAGVLCAAVLVTVLAGRRLVRPIRALTAAAQRMGAGDHTARVPVRGNDEVTRLGDAFNAMAESIGQADRQRKALVSDVSHELRTPLANVRSYLEAAEDGVLPLDLSLMRSLQEESALLERLVSDLHDLAMADAGKLRVHPEERDAADLAGQAVAAHLARAEASGVRLVLDAPESVPVLADPARLRQALGNLVSNAVTHTPPGGSVRVAVRPTDDQVVLTVADTGPGIAAEHLPHVFDRFYRADPSRSRSTGGSGLGLAITKYLVEAHEGHIEARSEPGQGARFTISLPTPSGLTTV